MPRRRAPADEERSEGSDIEEDYEAAGEYNDAAGSSDEDEGSDSDSDAGGARGIEDVPFGELLELKRNGGAAGFDREAAERAERALQRERSAAGERGKAKGVKRHKARPIELTSKKPVSRYREVVDIPNARRKASRDPRFDAMSGAYDEARFAKSYAFLEEYRSNESSQLKAELKKVRNEKKRAKLQVQLSKLASVSQVQKQKIEALKRKSELKQVSRELVQQGHKPFYFKKSDVKKIELAAKYQELKKKGGNATVDRAIEKKRKRNTTKAHKFIPYERRGGGGDS